MSSATPTGEKSLRKRKSARLSLFLLLVVRLLLFLGGNDRLTRITPLADPRFGNKIRTTATTLLRHCFVAIRGNRSSRQVSKNRTVNISHTEQHHTQNPISIQTTFLKPRKMWTVRVKYRTVLKPIFLTSGSSTRQAPRFKKYWKMLNFWLAWGTQEKY